MSLRSGWRRSWSSRSAKSSPRSAARVSTFCSLSKMPAWPCGSRNLLMCLRTERSPAAVMPEICARIRQSRQRISESDIEIFGEINKGVRMLIESQIEAAAVSLVRARAERTPLAGLPPESRPATLGDAYRIQRAYDLKSAHGVAGYKIGAASAASQKLVGATEPFLATVYRSACFDSPAHLPRHDFFVPGVEAEYAFEIGSDLPPRSEPYVRNEIAAAIAAVHPVIEICDNRFTDWRSTDLMQIIADNGFFGALVVGKRWEDWRAADLGSKDVVMRIDGAARGQGCCEAV